MVIAVDFDGTLFRENKYPEVGEPIWKNIEKIKRLQDEGHTLILWTCRFGENLEKAKNACKNVGLNITLANENCPERMKLYNGSDPRKIGADIYIDDRAVRPSEIDIIFEKEDKIWG